MPSARSKLIPSSLFGMVLGLSGLGQAWRIAVHLWHMPPVIGESILALSTIVWAGFLIGYLVETLRYPAATRDEFLHPISGSMPSLIGIATLQIALVILPYSYVVAAVFAAAGIGWHLVFALWHTSRLWQGNQAPGDLRASQYLPIVASNFVSGSVLGALGFPDWGWLFLGAGLVFWLSLESLVIQRLWHKDQIPLGHRSLLGIQFAPASVATMAWLNVDAGGAYGGVPDRWLLLLWGYGLFQLLLGLRLVRWLAQQPFTAGYWAYSFGVAAATLSATKLALAGVGPAQVLVWPIFILANLFIFYLLLRTMISFVRPVIGRTMGKIEDHASVAVRTAENS